MRLYKSFLLDAIANEIGDRNNFEVVFLGKHLQLRHPGHRAVVVHYLADDRRRGQARDTGHIDARFGLPDADKHAAAFRPQRENVARAGEVGRPSYCGSTAVRIVFARSAAEMPVVTPSRASIEMVNAVPMLDVLSCVCGGKLELVAAVFGQRQTDQAAAVDRHEIDDLRRHLLGRTDEIALILAVFVIDDDDHPAVANILDGLFDRC